MAHRLQTAVGALVLVVIVVTGLWSCSGKSPVSSIEEPGDYTELNWVGTSVVYQDAPGKRDISIIFVMADWCGWCTRMKKEALSDTTVIQMLGESYNIVYLNPDMDSLVVCGDSTVTCRVMARNVLDVRGYPTMIFFSRDGNVLGPAPGYRTTAAMIDILERLKDGEY